MGVAVGVFVLTSAANVVGETIVIENPQFNMDSTVLDRNIYWPLAQGDSYAYIAETEDGCEFNKLTVLANTGGYSNKMIKGIQMRVVRDQEWEAEPPDGVECDDPAIAAFAVLMEDTLDYYPIDDKDNIWYYGEDTWAVDDESPVCTDDGAWEAGVDEAVEGIVMLSQPTAGDRYQQEFWEDEAEDWGKVNRLNGKVGDEYSNCLVTKEWTPLEPGSVEHKYYCLDPPVAGPVGPVGSGLVFIEELQGKTVQVEFVGNDFGFGPLPGEGAGPGDGVDFPALDDVGSCVMPMP
jgi:hypothetical protein